MLNSLFYVTCEFHRFLHRGRARNFSNEETLFSLKENGTRHGRGTHKKKNSSSFLVSSSSLLDHTAIPLFAMTKHSFNV